MKDNTNTSSPRVLSRLKRPLPAGILDFLPPDALNQLEIDDIEIEADPEADARLDREALFDARLISLTPAERVVYLALGPVLDTHQRVQERLAGGGRLMISLRLPSQEWLYSAQAAFEAWLAGIHVESPELGQTVRVHTAKTDRFRAENIFDVRAVWREISIAHLLLVRGDDDELDETVEVALDADVFLREISFSIFETVLRERFGDDWSVEQPEGEGFAAADVDPSAFNSAIARCTAAVEVMSLVDALSAAARRREANRKKSREAEEKPKATGRQAISPSFPTSPKLPDLHGYGAAATWGMALCDDLAAYRNGDLAWSDVDTGCLLSGPPGTGKTLYASALAASSGLPFFATSFAHWQGSRGGHLGDIVKALRDWFAAASDAAPAILFIDEFDSIPARGSSREHDDYWVPIVNALLEVLDGTARREGLVVIAACNYPDKIDPAIVRSGRLDRRFEISLPGEDDLVRIFGHHLPELDGSVIEPVATALAGSCSGADAARIAREARRIARRAKRELVAEDLMAIALPPDTRSPEYRRLVAVHESGHAVAMMFNGRIPDVMSIVSIGESSGRVRSPVVFTMGRVGEFEREAVVMLAGRAAEDVIFGETSAGAASDLERATSIVTQLVASTGLGGRLAVTESVPASEIENRIRELYGRALRLVTEHRADVEALADLALERRVLSHRALTDFARERGIGGVR